MQLRSSQRKLSCGFTLIETLITMFVLAIGLLGLGGLQLSSLRNSHNAFLRSQASLQAYDMAERMRANMAGVINSDYDAIAGTPTDPSCISTLCTPAQMAQYDAFEWNTANAQLLPSGSGTVTRNTTGTPLYVRDFTIVVAWIEKKGSNARCTGPDSTSCNRKYIFDVRL